MKDAVIHNDIAPEKLKRTVSATSYPGITALPWFAARLKISNTFIYKNQP
jgi:hypothetical protein